jgi:acyl transferase domain-containing protein/thioesterase domain-containing protein
MSDASKVAIIGMAGRFPGAEGIEALWRNICRGVDSVAEIPSEALLQAGVDPALVEDPAYVRAGGLLEGIDLFDAEFFGYSPREAAIIDPQQRLLLQCAHEALEQSGHDPRAYRGRIGVFAGVSFSEYLATLLPQLGALRGLDEYALMLGNDKDFAATRIAYKLDLTGPAISVQTACSTSLVAVCQGIESLLGYQSDMVLAGGCSVRVPQLRGYLYQEGGILARDGRCRAFDAEASGTSVGSGVALVVLKRLEDALTDGDHVHAVISGYGLNNDGARKAGFAAPSPDGQAAAITQALAMADADAGSIGLIETHGTGTALGDSIELSALTAVFGRERREPRYLGALKTNLGHLDVAAGVAGLIKAALAVEHGIIPPTLHFRTPNPLADVDRSPFTINVVPVAWSGLRRAGVSAFGIGGTNAHVVVEQAPTPKVRCSNEAWQVLPVSARSAAAADRAVTRLADHLAATPYAALDDVAFTLQVGRQSFAHRRAVVARNAAEAAERLAGPVFLLGDTVDRRREVAFMFPGFGGDIRRATLELMREPVFREAFEACAECAPDPLGPGAGGSIARDMVALFSFEYALARTVMAAGVKPVAMVGHSLGQYVAACLADVFSLADAQRLVFERGRLMASLPAGAMLGVAMGEHALRETLTSFADGAKLSVAAVNAPLSCVLSGPAAAIERAVAEFQVRGVQTRHVPTGVPAHSAMLDPILPAFREIVAGLGPRTPVLPILSATTGAWLGAEAADPDYWVRHLRDTVRFCDAAATLLARGDTVLLELGPGQTLSTLARQSAAFGRSSRVVSCRPDPDGMDASQGVAAALAQLWLAGAEINWPARHREARRVRLPSYPFEAKRHWIEPTIAPRRAEPPPAVDASAGAADGLTATEQRVQAVWRELMGHDWIRPDDGFFDIGGDSLLALRVSSQIGRLIGRFVPPTAILRHPTIRRLAAHLDQGTARPATASLVPLRDGRGAPLFCIHPAGGNVLCYHHLAQLIALPGSIWGLKAHGLEAGEDPAAEVGELAERYLAAVADLQPDGAVHLLGHSFGGTIAFEMARQLRASGRSVGFLGLLDTPGPNQMPERLEDDAAILAYLAGEECGLAAEDLRGLDSARQLDVALGHGRLRELFPPDVDRDVSRRYVAVFKENVRAMQDYVPGPYDGPVHFYRAAVRTPPNPPCPELAWPPFVRDLEVSVVPGDHRNMVERPHVERLADVLTRHLRQCGWRAP